MYEQLCIISYLSSRIICWYLWKSHALLDDSLIRSNYSATPTPSSSLQSSFTRHSVQTSNILSRTILRLATETERVLSHPSIHAPAHLTHSYVPQIPSSTKSRSRRIAFLSHAFRVSPQTSIFVIPPLHALQHFKPLFLSPNPHPPSIITNATLKFYPALESHVLYFEMKLESGFGFGNETTPE